ACSTPRRRRSPRRERASSSSTSRASTSTSTRCARGASARSRGPSRASPVPRPSTSATATAFRGGSPGRSRTGRGDGAAAPRPARARRSSPRSRWRARPPASTPPCSRARGARTSSSVSSTWAPRRSSRPPSWPSGSARPCPTWIPRASTPAQTAAWYRDRARRRAPRWPPSWREHGWSAVTSTGNLDKDSGGTLESACPTTRQYPMEGLAMRRLLVCSLVFGMLLTGATVPALAQDTLKIGAPQPMTGPDAPFGDKFKKAYSMAVDEINAKGGVNGKKLEVIIDDHQAKNALAATVAEKLITQGKVLVLTGGRASGQAVEIASVAQRLKTPYVVDHPSADIITAKGFEWVFRNNPTGSIYPQAFNKFITEVPGAMPKSAAVVYDNSVFGKTISNSAMTFLKSKAVPIVNDEAYPVNSLDFKPVMTKVKANNPDYLLLVAVATTDAILLTRHAKEIGVAPRAFVGFGAGFGVEASPTELAPHSHTP